MKQFLWLGMGLILLQGCFFKPSELPKPVNSESESQLNTRKDKIKLAINQLSAEGKLQSIKISFGDLSKLLRGDDIATLMRKKQGDANFAEVVDLSHADTSYEDADVVSTAQYVYKISVFLSGDTGSVDSSEINAAVLTAQAIPTTPSILSCNQISNGNTIVTFMDQSNNELTFVIVREAKNYIPAAHDWTDWHPSGTVEIVSNAITSIGQQIQAYSLGIGGANISYRYKIKAVNDAGESSLSDYCQ